jgi:hypothetical protein
MKRTTLIPRMKKHGNSRPAEGNNFDQVPPSDYLAAEGR